MSQAAALPGGIALSEAERRPPAFFERVQLYALVAGAVGAVLMLIGAVIDPARFFPAYMTGYFFVFRLSVGCLLIAMIHSLTRGAWGFLIRPLLIAGIRLLPYVAVAFIPIAIGMFLGYLYPWNNAHTFAPNDPLALNHEAQAVLRYREVWGPLRIFGTTPVAWTIRAVFYLIAICVVAHYMVKWILAEDATDDPRYSAYLRRLGGGGGVFMAGLLTFAFLDWILSVEYYFASTMHPVILAVGALSMAVALIVIFMTRLFDMPPLKDVLRLPHINDLGAIMLTSVMFWAYVSVSQFLLIWAGNLPEEVEFYLVRSQGWFWWLFSAAVILLFFAVPFYILLFRTVRRSPKLLGWFALYIFVMRYAETVWLIVPPFGHPPFGDHGLLLHWLDVVAPLAFIGLWLAGFAWEVRKRPILMLNSLRLQARGELLNDIH